MTWIAVNDLLKNWTARTENNLVSFELSLIIRDQRDVRISSLLVEIFEHQLEMLREAVPVESVLFCHHCSSSGQWDDFEKDILNIAKKNQNGNEIKFFSLSQFKPRPQFINSKYKPTLNI